MVKSIHKLRNNRAPRYDEIPPELLKYAPPELHDLIAESLNNIFAKHKYINVGHGLVTALQKTSEPKGPTKSLRLVIFLIMLRKVISNIVLTRIQPTVEEYLSHSQSAYRHDRSTSDIVWCHRFLTACVQKFQEEIMITGKYMTSAFDTKTFDSKLIEILESFLREDEIRIIRILLSNTTLDIKSSSNISKPFDTNVGSPQGDGLSGCLFTIYLEKALCTLHDRVDNNHVIGEHSYAVGSKSTLQDEYIYAEDTDLINDCAEKTKRQLELVNPTFLEFNLQINDTKTQHTVLKRSDKKNEEWRSTKKLGSLMGDQEDILHRKQLSTTVLQNLNNI